MNYSFLSTITFPVAKPDVQNEFSLTRYNNDVREQSQEYQELLLKKGEQSITPLIIAGAAMLLLLT